MIIFLYGEETYLSRQKLNELKAKFLRDIDPAGSSLMTINGETATMDKISSVTSSLSLFAKKRMIVIERLFAQKSQTVLAQAYDFFKKSYGLGSAGRPDKKNGAAAPGGENILIFYETAAASGKFGSAFWRTLGQERYAQNFKPLSNTEAAAWVRTEAAAKGGRISLQAAARLVSLTGNDLWRLKNEIEKLISYKQGLKPALGKNTDAVIEVPDITSLVRGKLSENIFALTDAIGNRNKAEALRLLEEELEAGVAESHLLGMVERQFRIIMQVRQSLDLGQSARKIASQLKLHPFVAQKSLSQVRNFSLPAAKRIFLELVKVEKSVKSGEADTKTALSLLFAKI